MQKNNKKAVILLSGGLDSATTLAIASAVGYECHAISFSYHQRHCVEIKSAIAIASAANIARHKMIDIDLAAFGGSALTDDSIAVPMDNPDIGPAGAIPITYVPARNTIFLSYALAFAEVIGSFDIFIGVNATDYSGYPDCRPEYIDAFEKMANLATASTIGGERRFTIHTPIIELSKAEIIRKGTSLGVNYSLTHSCYNPDDDGIACGHCDSCRLRLKGFAVAGMTDPIKYQGGK